MNVKQALMRPLKTVCTSRNVLLTSCRLGVGSRRVQTKVRNMKTLLRLGLCLFILVFATESALARTWRDPKYGGLYSFGEDGVLTVTHPGREYSGKWWLVDKSSVKFQLFDQSGKATGGVSSLIMRTETTATVKLSGLANSLRWNLVEDRGYAAQDRDPAESGWFMEELRF